MSSEFYVCECERRFKSATALLQHRRDAPIHKQQPLEEVFQSLNVDDVMAS